jgi:hypothetical protein
MSTAPLPHPTDSAASPAPSTTDWEDLVRTAVQERVRRNTTAEGVIGTGELDVQLLCRYAAGHAHDAERREIESVLAHRPWALTRITSLVRASRGQDSKGQLARRVLEASQQSPVDPYRVLAEAIIDGLKRDDAQALVQRQDVAGLADLPDVSPLLRAACLLGLGQRADAREAFGGEGETTSELAPLAERVAAHDDSEEALVEVLQFF